MDSRISIIGSGPASLSFCTEADKMVGWERIKSRISIISSENVIGAGSLRRWQIPIHAYKDKLWFDSGEGLPIDNNSLFPYPGMDTFQDHMSCLAKYYDRIGNIIENSFDANNFVGSTNVDEIEEQEDGSYFVRNTVGDIVSQANNIIIATGIRESIQESFSRYAKDGTYFLSEDIVSNEKVDHVLNMIEDNPDARVVFIGASHSTFSALTNIFQKIDDRKMMVSENTFQIFAKKDPQFFFENIQEARSLGFTDHFSADQICPQTKRINTASGLRGYRRDLALRIIKRKEKRAVFCPVFVKDDDIRNDIASATCTIQATGHVARARDIRYTDKSGKNLVIGENISNEQLRLCFNDKNSIHNIFALGATAQAPFIPSFGGEKRSKNGNTAVRFYTRHANIILNQILIP